MSDVDDDLETAINELGLRDSTRAERAAVGLALTPLAQALSAQHGPWAARLLRRFVAAIGDPSKAALLVDTDGLQQLQLAPPARMNAAACGRCAHGAAAHEGTRSGDRCHYPGCSCPGFHHDPV